MEPRARVLQNRLAHFLADPRYGAARTLGICCLLGAATLAAYGRVSHCDFVNYDDPIYVTNCPQIKEGLTWHTFVWAFSSTHACNWHPLTTLSLLAESRLFGLNPTALHLTNLLLHTANGILLFLVLQAMTG